MSHNYRVLPGIPLPLGAHLIKKGVQFSIFSRNASSVHLIFINIVDNKATFTEIPLDPQENCTGDIWHIYVEGIKSGQMYGFRIDGPDSPESGHRFDPGFLIMDPCAKAVINLAEYRDTTELNTDEIESSFRIQEYQPVAVVTEPVMRNMHPSPGSSLEDTLIYEIHVRGFTMHESSKVKTPGTFKGLMEKIPYLKELGVTAVELLPVQEFDKNDNPNANPITGQPLVNFWGYNTVAFFAPNSAYSSNKTEQIKEFREMVDAFHRQGIEIILDVVFNHTGESDENGPVYSFKGIDNSIYYILDNDRAMYSNYSGCGNTVNCNHPLVRDFILDCLRYWVIDMGIDGFRFDLASILGRDRDGTILPDAPLIERIEEDPILRNVKIIAEAWDAAGAYQVGGFPGRWAEWNGKFRDDVRRFWRGDRDSLADFATRLLGSSDLYDKSEKGPRNSINFITCHDGFTLNDLVTYSKKHNIENGEENRDGENHNISCNYGVEGPDASPEIKELRLRQIKNFIATLFLSQGTPMLLSGDEFRRTQKGNNNSYCQDNEISWINWDLLELNKEIHSFTKKMMSFRKAHPLLRRKRFFTGNRCGMNHKPDVQWFDARGDLPDWGGDDLSIGALLNGSCIIEEYEDVDNDLLLLFNANDKIEYFVLPEPPQKGLWSLEFDTTGETSDEIFEGGSRILKNQGLYNLAGHSIAVLIQTQINK